MIWLERSPGNQDHPKVPTDLSSSRTVLISKGLKASSGVDTGIALIYAPGVPRQTDPPPEL
jgi:hypothetical protein